MEVEPVIVNNLPISFQTDTLNINFKVEFGKGLDSEIYSDSRTRTQYEKPYNFEKYDVDGNNMYRLLAEEGPFVLNVSSVNVTPKNRTYRKEIVGGYIEYHYGITAVLDINNEPEYSTPTSFYPSNNIERDGKPWFVKNGKMLRVDQNGEGSFQWSTAKALDKGVKPTAEQELMGVEERHENSGMIYITFQPVYTEETHYYEVEEEEPVYRGFGGPTRSATRGITRGCGGEGVTRGITKSSAARVGYGSSAKTSSTSVSPKAIPNSRFVLPIRLRTIGDTSDKAKCAKDLTSAIRVDDLQKKTRVMPDVD